MTEKLIKTAKKIKDFLYVISYMLQYFVAATIIIAIIITLVSLPSQLKLLTDMESDSLIHYLEYIIITIIALELIHVLCHQSIDSIVEILSLAITRELIIEKMSTFEFFIGVMSLLVLFIMRKFLFVSKLDKGDETEKKEKVFILKKPNFIKSKEGIIIRKENKMDKDREDKESKDMR